MDPELVVSHPPHLMSGSAVSAFIPFCAFEGQLRISESLSRLPNLTFPICQSFVPTSLDGQLCYKLQVNRTTKGSENREGLVLILDMNEDRSLAVDSPQNIMSKDDPIDFSMNLMTNPKRNSAVLGCCEKIYSHLLRTDHFVLQRAETALKALQGKLLDARFLVKGCMLMLARLKCPKTLITTEL